jgi:hypothetical protein
MPSRIARYCPLAAIPAVPNFHSFCGFRGVPCDLSYTGQTAGYRGLRVITTKVQRSNSGSDDDVVGKLLHRVARRTGRFGPVGFPVSPLQPDFAPPTGKQSRGGGAFFGAASVLPACEARIVADAGKLG